VACMCFKVREKSSLNTEPLLVTVRSFLVCVCYSQVCALYLSKKGELVNPDPASVQ